MVDLPHHSVIVSGLEEWSFGDARQPIFEDRLVSKLEALLEVKGLSLFAPPTEPKDLHAAPAGITGWQFPEWFVAQYEEWRGSYPARPLVHRRGLVNERYVAPDRKRLPVVPVRFVQGCVNGHISDIDWYRFVHENAKEPCRRPLWMEERGTSGDLADVFVACECGKVRSMGVAAVRGADTLGFCRGLRPWLGPVASERCGGEEGKPQPNRLLLRSASDAYFSQVLRVISIPDRDAELKMAVDKVWEDFLQYVEGLDDLKRERRKAKVFGALEGHPDVGVLAEIERRKGGSAASPKSIKQVEIETLLASGDQIGEDVPEGADFYARRLPVGNAGVLKAVERVVLLDRLREVMALVGLSRSGLVMSSERRRHQEGGQGDGESATCLLRRTRGPMRASWQARGRSYRSHDEKDSQSHDRGSRGSHGRDCRGQPGQRYPRDKRLGDLHVEVAQTGGVKGLRPATVAGCHHSANDQRNKSLFRVALYVPESARHVDSGRPLQRVFADLPCWPK